MNLKSTRVCPGFHNLLIWNNWTQVIYLMLSNGGQQHPATDRLQRNLQFLTDLSLHDVSGMLKKSVTPAQAQAS